MNEDRNESPPDFNPWPAAASAALVSYPRLLLAAALAYGALLALAYGPSLNAPYSYDDLIRVREIRVETLEDVRQVLIGARDLQGFSSSFVMERPVGNFSFALQAWLDFDDPWAHRSVNLIIHWLNAMLAFHLVFITARLCLAKKDGSGFEIHRILAMDGANAKWAAALAFSAVLLWVIHPVQIQAVTYIAQRYASLSALFMLMALALYLHGSLSGSRRIYWICLIFCFDLWILAILTKQNRFVLPVLILLYETGFFQDRGARRATLRVAGAVVILLAALMAWDWYAGGHSVLRWLDRQYLDRPFTMLERLMTEGRVVLYYLTLLVWPAPSRLQVIYDIPLSTSWLDPVTTLPSMAAVIALLLFAAWSFDNWWWLSFAIYWYFVNLAIESTIIPLDLMWVHRLYLPSMSVALLGTLALFHLRNRMRWRLPAVALPAVLVPALLGITIHRNLMWNDPMALVRGNVEKAPNDPRVLTYMGVLVQEAGTGDAMMWYDKAVEADPNYYQSHLFRALRHLENGNWPEALKDAERAEYLLPGLPTAQIIKGDALLKMHYYEKAANAYGFALSRQDGLVDVLYKRAYAYSRLDRWTEAMADLERVLEANPLSPRAYMLIGAIHEERGSPAQAIEAFQFASRLRPGDPEPRRRLGLAFESLGRARPARDHYQAFLDLAEEEGGWEEGILEDIQNRLNKMQSILDMAPKPRNEPARESGSGDSADSATGTVTNRKGNGNQHDE